MDLNKTVTELLAENEKLIKRLQQLMVENRKLMDELKELRKKKPN